jgi:hypothetical protein
MVIIVLAFCAGNPLSRDFLEGGRLTYNKAFLSSLKPFLIPHHLFTFRFPSWNLLGFIQTSGGASVPSFFSSNSIKHHLSLHSRNWSQT